MANPKRALRQLALLESADLDTLIERFPEEWQAVGQALVDATSTKRPEAIEAFVRSAQEAALPHRQRVERSGKNPQVLTVALPHLVRGRMATLAAKRAVQAAALGAGRRHRFSLWNGLLIQRLFFARGLVRKPVAMRTFRWLWPLVTQKRLLMPLVTRKGIYAFYSDRLISALATLIGKRATLEIAAGDGCLSRFLGDAGVTITATDDHSWAHAIAYPELVHKVDAEAALARYQPAVVLCSFPPPNNDFEAKVFATDSVETYLVITTRHQFAAGNWESYRAQTAFEMSSDPRLSRLILPPELDPALLVFQRKR